MVLRKLRKLLFIMWHIITTIAFLLVIKLVNSVPLDVEKSPEPFVIVAQSGDPFNENHDINVPEASIAESGNL